VRRAERRRGRGISGFVRRTGCYVIACSVIAGHVGRFACSVGRFVHSVGRIAG
jgi:hypothetical protein